MVTSDEPGVYIEGEYGIRIENEIVCVKDYENEYGTFLRFEMLTCVPIDLDLVELQYLNAADRERLNQYHTWVFSELSPYMSGEELDFLKEYTRTV
jgi:Xaa-Pro aminopeptidase